jgi:hypothetical protein
MYITRNVVGGNHPPELGSETYDEVDAARGAWWPSQLGNQLDDCFRPTIWMEVELQVRDGGRAKGKDAALRGAR